MGKLKRFLVPVMLLIIFEIVAVVLWLAKGELFYLLNFSYIGICLSGGLILYAYPVSYTHLGLRDAEAARSVHRWGR